MATQLFIYGADNRLFNKKALLSQDIAAANNYKATEVIIRIGLKNIYDKYLIMKSVHYQPETISCFNSLANNVTSDDKGTRVVKM